MTNLYYLVWNSHRYVSTDGIALLAFAKYLGDPYAFRGGASKLNLFIPRIERI